MKVIQVQNWIMEFPIGIIHWNGSSKFAWEDKWTIVSVNIMDVTNYTQM